MTPAKFRHLVIHHSQGSPSEADIAALEEAIGTKLPTDFREFLMVGNGGSMEYEVRVDHTQGHERMSFSRFFSFRRLPSSRGEWGTFHGELKEAREAFRIPREVLPIARDGGGSTLLLDLTPEGRGRVIAFIDGFAAWTGPREYAFLEVAPSFSDYIDKLYIPEEHARELIEEAKKQNDSTRLNAIKDWLELGMPDWRSRLGCDVFGTP
jgi:cell wall assembly regulator SMI1